jgi:hypothetical protein
MGEKGRGVGLARGFHADGYILGQGIVKGFEIVPLAYNVEILSSKWKSYCITLMK